MYSSQLREGRGRKNKIGRRSPFQGSNNGERDGVVDLHPTNGIH